MHSFKDNIKQQIDFLEQQNQLRKIVTYNQLENCFIEKDGKKLLSFASNDYLGFSKHPEIKNAAKNAVDKYGVGSGASRLVTGNHPLYDELEKMLCELHNAEAACIFGSGYLCNIGVLQSLTSKEDLIIADKLSHNSLLNGAKLSDAKLKRFKHNDLNSLEKILSAERRLYKNCLVITEKVFSMDGDRAPLKEISRLCQKYDAILLSDGAHDLRIGEKDNYSDLKVGTLSKAYGGYGGYVCGDKEYIDFIKTKASSLIYSTSLPASVLVAVIKAMELIKENEDLCDEPIKKAEDFCNLMNLPKPQSQIVPVILGENNVVVEVSRFLEQVGFYVPAIRPPTVPKGSARLRFSFCAQHKKDDIERFCKLYNDINFHNDV